MEDENKDYKSKTKMNYDFMVLWIFLGFVSAVLILTSPTVIISIELKIFLAFMLIVIHPQLVILFYKIEQIGNHQEWFYKKMQKFIEGQ